MANQLEKASTSSSISTRWRRSAVLATRSYRWSCRTRIRVRCFGYANEEAYRETLARGSAVLGT